MKDGADNNAKDSNDDKKDPRAVLVDFVLDAGKQIRRFDTQDLIEQYATKVYPKYQEVASRVSDALPLPLYDFTLLATLLGKTLPKDGKTGQVADILSKVSKTMLQAGIFSQINRFRKPLEKKLGIEKDLEHLISDDELRRDTAATAQRIHTLCSQHPISTKRSYADLNERSERYVSRVISDFDGVSIRSPKRVKPSLVTKGLQFFGGSKVTYTAASGEVTRTWGPMTYDIPFALCYAKAVAKGYPRSHEAKFLSYEGCSGSDDPLFAYSAQMVRLGEGLTLLFRREDFGVGLESIQKAKDAASEYAQGLMLPDDSKAALMVRFQRTHNILESLRMGFALLEHYTIKMRDEETSDPMKFLAITRAYERRVGA